MFPCYDCGIDTSEISEYYMVTDDIWLEFGVGNGFLCIGCLEKRMDRKLNKSDFIDMPINWLRFGPKSERLINRLKGE